VTSYHAKIRVPRSEVFNFFSSCEFETISYAVNFHNLCHFDFDWLYLSLVFKVSDYHFVGNSHSRGRMVPLLLIRQIYQLVRAVEKLTDVTTMILQEYKFTTWMKVIIVFVLNNLVVKKQKGSFFIVD
jgi:hypothetical protein